MGKFIEPSYSVVKFITNVEGASKQCIDLFDALRIIKMFMRGSIQVLQLLEHEKDIKVGLLFEEYDNTSIKLAAVAELDKKTESFNYYFTLNKDEINDLVENYRCHYITDDAILKYIKCLSDECYKMHHIQYNLWYTCAKLVSYSIIDEYNLNETTRVNIMDAVRDLSISHV